MKVCDYPPCDRPATTEVVTPARTIELCDEHATRASVLKRRLTAMTDEEYRAYVKEIVDQAPPLDDTQRARLGRLLRRARTP